jgi:radical SAM protein with 4Fe4S-binding SPASM domain
MRMPKLPLRRQYLRIAWRALREGKAGWVVRQGLKTLAVPVSAFVERPLAGPLMVNFLTTYRCNSACFMCDWGQPWFYEKRGAAELDTASARRVIDDIAGLGTVGLNFTGGEPTLREDLYELAAHAKAAGLFVNVNSNAHTLTDPVRVASLIEAGVDALNFSIDGARAGTHDRLRGVPGSFERVRRATELVLAGRHGGQPTVTYMFVVGPENHAELHEFIEMARERGVDSVSFIPLLAIYRDHRPLPPEKLAAMAGSVDWLRRAKRTRWPRFIDNSDDYLSMFARSWRGEPSPLRCYAPYAHLVIDCYGNVYPCGVWIHADRRIGNVRDTRLAALWRSEAYRAARRELADCRACYWNCHAEANLLYQGTGD